MRRRVLRVRLPPRARTTMTTTAPRRLVEETVVLAQTGRRGSWPELPQNKAKPQSIGRRVQTAHRIGLPTECGATAARLALDQQTGVRLPAFQPERVAQRQGTTSSG